MKNKISVIIPSYYNEFSTLKTVNNLLSISKDIELIIIYKGEKFEFLKKNLIKIQPKLKLVEYNGESSRSILMNLGAKKSTGDILLFLHNDTILPKNYFEILQNINLEKYNYGGFYKQFYPNNFILKINSFIGNIRLKYFKTLLGDNSIYISKKLYFKIGGFPNIDLMEDVEISKKLKKIGKIHVIKSKTITSSIKFIKNGTIKTLIYMFYLRYLYLIGVNSKVLKEKYSRF